MAQENIYYATGKRKSAIARTWLQPGKGKILINNRELDDYFPVPSAKNLMLQPLKLTNQLDKFDIRIKVAGGGLQGQAGAIRHGISRALLEFDADLRITLKKAGFIRRDSRVKERKKYGQRGARARYQFSKR